MNKHLILMVFLLQLSFISCKKTQIACSELPPFDCDRREVFLKTVKGPEGYYDLHFQMNFVDWGALGMYFLVRRDLAGNVLWGNRFEVDELKITSLTLTDDGICLLAGNIESESGQGKLWLKAFDPDGQEVLNVAQEIGFEETVSFVRASSLDEITVLSQFENSTFSRLFSIDRNGNQRWTTNLLFDEVLNKYQVGEIEYYNYFTSQRPLLKNAPNGWYVVSPTHFYEIDLSGNTLRDQALNWTTGSNIRFGKQGLALPGMQPGAFWGLFPHDTLINNRIRVSLIKMNASGICEWDEQVSITRPRYFRDFAVPEILEKRNGNVFVFNEWFCAEFDPDGNLLFTHPFDPKIKTWIGINGVTIMENEAGHARVCMSTYSTRNLATQPQMDGVWWMDISSDGTISGPYPPGNLF